MCFYDSIFLDLLKMLLYKPMSFESGPDRTEHDPCWLRRADRP